MSKHESCTVENVKTTLTEEHNAYLTDEEEDKQSWTSETKPKCGGRQWSKGHHEEGNVESPQGHARPC